MRVNREHAEAVMALRQDILIDSTDAIWNFYLSQNRRRKY